MDSTSQLEQQYIDRLLAQAWLSDVGRERQKEDRSLGRTRQSAETGQKLGFCQSLDGYPSVDPTLDLPMPPLVCVDGATIFSQAAQAYVQWVPLHDIDQARALLPPGQSERVDDPSRTINVDRWAKGELHAAPITRKSVERITVSSKRL